MRHPVRQNAGHRRTSGNDTGAFTDCTDAFTLLELDADFADYAEKNLATN